MTEKVILIDDDPTTLSYLKIILQKAGFETQLAKDGQEALEKIPLFKPDVIISDLIMPEMDGLELLQELKRRPETTLIPFFFISGKAEITDQLEGLKSGANDYFCKPVRTDELIARIRQVIRESKWRKASSMRITSFTGKLNDIQLADIIQLIEKNVISGRLVIFNEKLSRLGDLYVDSGELIEAKTGNLTGAEAFFELWKQKSGYFEFLSHSVHLRKNIKKSSKSLMLEASVLEDEFEELKSYLPAFDVRLNLKSKKVPSRLVKKVGEKGLFFVTYLIVHGITVGNILKNAKISSLRTGAILSNLFQYELIEYIPRESGET